MKCEKRISISTCPEYLSISTTKPKSTLEFVSNYDDRRRRLAITTNQPYANDHLKISKLNCTMLWLEIESKKKKSTDMQQMINYRWPKFSEQINFCAEKSNGYYFLKNCSPEYIACLFGNAYAMRCSPNLIFNHKTKSCDERKNERTCHNSDNIHNNNDNGDNQTNQLRLEKGYFYIFSFFLYNFLLKLSYDNENFVMITRIIDCEVNFYLDFFFFKNHYSQLLVRLAPLSCRWY